MRTVRQTSGFTLIELLIVIAIIGLLISLSIPAIQASREAARRTHCSSNLHEFGLAFMGYESQQKALPAAFTLRVKGPLSALEVQSFSVFAELLPHIEELGIAANYHQDAFFCEPQNALAIGSIINIALCPSTPRESPILQNSFVPSRWASGSLGDQLGGALGTLDTKYSANYKGAVTDYSVPVRAPLELAKLLGYNLPPNSKTELRSVFPLPDTDKLIKDVVRVLFSSGVVQASERTRLSQISDGLSKTFIMTEAAGRPEHWRKGQRSYVREPLMSAWADPLIGILIRDPDAKDGKCIVNCDNEANIYSFHNQGVNFLFADGHVSFFDEQIDPALLLAMMTPDKNESTP